MVVAGVIIGIVFLVSGNNNNKSQAKSKVTTTTTATKSGNATAQAQANEVAVKAGCPASTKTRGEHPEVRLSARR